MKAKNKKIGRKKVGGKRKEAGGKKKVIAVSCKLIAKRKAKS